MKLEQFKKLALGTKVYDTENKEFVTKAYILTLIKDRALEIARDSSNLEGEEEYIYGWIIDRLEPKREKEVKQQVKDFLKKHGFENLE